MIVVVFANLFSVLLDLLSLLARSDREKSQVEARILAKDKLVQTYRSNLPDGAELWLLLYTGVTVARSMPIPHGIEVWRIPFRFDRVFWFTSLEGQFVEILNK